MQKPVCSGRRSIRLPGRQKPYLDHFGLILENFRLHCGSIEKEEYLNRKIKAAFALLTLIEDIYLILHPCLLLCPICLTTGRAIKSGEVSLGITPKRARKYQIGRASCRERGQI